MAFWSIGHILNKIFDSTLSALGVKAAGDVAHDAADSGNPIKVGFKAESTTPAAVADGDRSDLGGTLYGAAFVNPVTSAGAQLTGATGAAVPAGAVQLGGPDQSSNLRAPSVANPAYDGVSETGRYAMHVATHESLYNPSDSKWYLKRGNVTSTPFTSAARTATSSSADQVLYNGTGVRVTINVTSITDTPSVVFTIEVKDSVSGNYSTVLTSAAIVGTGTTTLRVYPGIATAANVAVNDIMARTWRVTATHADADSITYSVSADMML